MAIISQQSWDKLTEEEKEKIRRVYSEAKSTGTRNPLEYEFLFGKENLQPKPKIRTWRDIEKEYPKILTDFQELNVEITCCCGIEYKIGNKMLATAKIAKLIELGYGGIVTEEEWRDENINKFSIVCEGNRLSIICLPDERHFISFHYVQQAEEFMSYEENVKLIKQYHII